MKRVCSWIAVYLISGCPPSICCDVYLVDRLSVHCGSSDGRSDVMGNVKYNRCTKVAAKVPSRGRGGGPLVRVRVRCEASLPSAALILGTNSVLVRLESTPTTRARGDRKLNDAAAIAR